MVSVQPVRAIRLLCACADARPLGTSGRSSSLPAWPRSRKRGQTILLHVTNDGTTKARRPRRRTRVAQASRASHSGERARAKHQSRARNSRAYLRLYATSSVQCYSAPCLLGFTSHRHEQGAYVRLYPRTSERYKYRKHLMPKSRSASLYRHRAVHRRSLSIHSRTIPTVTSASASPPSPPLDPK